MPAERILEPIDDLPALRARRDGDAVIPEIQQAERMHGDQLSAPARPRAIDQLRARPDSSEPSGPTTLRRKELTSPLAR